MLHIFPIFTNFMTREKRKKNIGHCYAKLEFMGFRNGILFNFKNMNTQHVLPLVLMGNAIHVFGVSKFKIVKHQFD